MHRRWLRREFFSTLLANFVLNCARALPQDHAAMQRIVPERQDTQWMAAESMTVQPLSLVSRRDMSPRHVLQTPQDRSVAVALAQHIEIVIGSLRHGPCRLPRHGVPS